MTRFLAIALLVGCHPDAERAPLEVRAFPDRPLVRQLTLDADEATVECVAGDDPEEVHRPVPEGSAPIRFALGGLRADTDYRCTASTGAFADFHTDPLPEGVGFVLQGAEPSSGYTAFNHWILDPEPGSNQELVVVDPLGRVVAWQPLGRSAPAIDVALAPTGELFAGGGPDLHPRWFDALGAIRATLTEPPIPGPYHHHAEPLPDGSVLALTFEDNTDGDQVWQGFAVQWLEPDGSPIWTWRSGEHLAELPVRLANQDDPWHPNSVSLREDALGPSAWVSLSWADAIIRIDRSSGAVTHLLGEGGDFALLDPTGAALDDSGWFETAHDPEWDGDRVLLHANGNPFSGTAIVEYEVDLTALTATRLWDWTEPGWFEPLFGDADWIGSRILVTRGRCWPQGGCASIPSDPERHSAILEVDPATGEVPWRLETLTTQGGIYRAERLDPCALWTNERWCPSR